MVRPCACGMASAGISSSAASAPAGSSNLASSVASTPPAPVLRRKPQSKGNVGAGKLYADHAAFQADVDAWNLEQAEHKKKMAERKRDLDKQRDRSGRQRGNEQETDSERVVRQRQENAAAADNHAQQQAAQRQKSRLRSNRRGPGTSAFLRMCAAALSRTLIRWRIHPTFVPAMKETRGGLRGSEMLSGSVHSATTSQHIHPLATQIGRLTSITRRMSCGGRMLA